MDDLLGTLRIAMLRVYRHLRSIEQKAAKATKRVHARQQASAVNLIHYLALRSSDLRDLQDELHEAGLSSLASAESHVLWQVQAVLKRLGVQIPEKDTSDLGFTAGVQLLQQRAHTLFGPNRKPDIPYLMVTFDRSLADDYISVKHLLKAGMNIARINCAHDDQETWLKMIHNVRKAAHTTGKPCKVYLDLAGPKIRTVLLGKGRKKGRMKLLPDEWFYLAEPGAEIVKSEKVIGCTLPGVVKDLRVGQRVLFDDGLFEAVVESPGEEIAGLRLIRSSAAKPRLKPEKGINFPDTELSVRSLTEFDKSLLPFALQHADLLGYSFVRSAADVAELQSALRAHSETPLPIILKIETYEAVHNLPDLLLQGMSEQVFGVMIARGDLAVEIGFERLSEIQEEILWVCESAHVPVIWATQVLDTLNKSGLATRSELTDAAYAAHAECVMLNKGKHLLTVLATLQDILQRSGGHHVKKRYVFRPLKIAQRYLNGKTFNT